MPDNLLPLMRFTHQLADTAKSITLSYFRQRIDSQQKSDGSPVTIADAETEMALRQLIEKHYPAHGIIGEEHAAKPAKCEFEWIIDPIDGTKNFIAGLPLYGCLICLLQNGRPVVSLIDIPAQNERWSATANSSSQYQSAHTEQHASTTDNTQLATSTLCSTDYHMFTQEEHSQLVSLRQSVGNIRYNGDCYLYGMLSSGWVDIVLESDLKVHDFLPLVLIVEQAGGLMTDWQGNPLNKNSQGQVLATANANLHQQALAHINNHTSSI